MYYESNEVIIDFSESDRDRAFQYLRDLPLRLTRVSWVHKIIRQIDRGEPILVRVVEANEENTLEVFERRIHQTEWGMLVEVKNSRDQCTATVGPVSHVNKRPLPSFSKSLSCGSASAWSGDGQLASRLQPHRSPCSSANGGVTPSP